MQYAEAIYQLRKKYPIGVKAAQKLLQETGGNLFIAEQIWQQAQVLRLAKRLEINLDESKDLLREVNFDFEKALRLQFERNTSDSKGLGIKDLDENKPGFGS